MMDKRFVLFLILMVIAFLGLPLFFMAYPCQVAYYVESDYDTFSRIIFIPALIGIFVLVTYKSVKHDIKRGVFNLFEYIKQTPYLIFGCMLVYSFIALTFNGFLLFLNINLGHQNAVQIKGKVVEEYVYVGGKTIPLFQLTILNESDKKLYKFTTQRAETERYYVNSRFEKKMEKGLFGFIYLK